MCGNQTGNQKQERAAKNASPRYVPWAKMATVTEWHFVEFCSEVYTVIMIQVPLQIAMTSNHKFNMVGAFWHIDRFIFALVDIQLSKLRCNALRVRFSQYCSIIEVKKERTLFGVARISLVNLQNDSACKFTNHIFSTDCLNPLFGSKASQQLSLKSFDS